MIRDDAHALHQLLDDPVAADELRALELVLEEAFLEHDSEIIEPAEGARLAELIEASSAFTRSPTLAARATICAIDSALGRRFYGLFRDRGEVRLREGEPLPIASHPVLDFYPDRITVNPASLDGSYASVPNLCLLPDDLQHCEVWADFRFRDELAEIGPESRFVVALPNRALNELHWTEEEREGQHYFFDVRPKDADSQRRRLEELVARATEHQAAILVCPELCLCTTTWAAVSALPGLAEIPLAVVGSHHVLDDDGKRRNEACIMVRGRSDRMRHRKLSRFSFKSARGARITEDIARAPARVTIAYTDRWSFSVLICKDAIEKPVADLLPALHLRMLLVPACSPKTEPFESLADKLSISTQALVLVANAADPTSEAQPFVAIFGRPVRDDRVLCVSHRDVTPPALVLFTPTGKWTTA